MEIKNLFNGRKLKFNSHEIKFLSNIQNVNFCNIECGF